VTKTGIVSSAKHMAGDELKDRIQAARKSAGLSQSELARRLKVTPATVNQWEGGHTAPRDRLREQLASLLNEPSLLERRIFTMETEGEQIPPSKLSPDVLKLVRPYLDKKCEIWRIDTDMMARTDVKRGYYAVVLPGTTNTSDIVLAFVNDVPVFRMLWPPYLGAWPEGPKPPDIPVDKLKVKVHGKVVWSFPPPR
jgi:transcriptional regulator with XRE-family HTH domain